MDERLLDFIPISGILPDHCQRFRAVPKHECTLEDVLEDILQHDKEVTRIFVDELISIDRKLDYIISETVLRIDFDEQRHMMPYSIDIDKDKYLGRYVSEIRTYEGWGARKYTIYIRRKQYGQILRMR